jgi:hypothetical protein
MSPVITFELNDGIFMKLGMNFTPPEAIPSLFIFFLSRYTPWGHMGGEEV